MLTFKDGFSSRRGTAKVIDFYTHMIKEANAKKYCCEDISLIENYDKAISDQT